MTILVKMRRTTKPGSKIAAFADVTLGLPDGNVELRSFSVFRPNGKPAWISPPASKGEKKFFPYYSLGGELRKRVEAAVLMELEKVAPKEF